MRRADRLFQIIQLLDSKQAVTARTLATALEVSERTIYRDIQDLSATGVPIIGETGIGYKLMPGYHLPPLMFSEEELSALLLGARMVQAWSDRDLARAATSALKKIGAVTPEHLRAELNRNDILVPDFNTDSQVATALATLRSATKLQRKVRFAYTREDGTASTRTVHPLGLFYWGRVWTLVAWCELRDAFRHFRLDRMNELLALLQNFESVPGRTLTDYLSQYE